MNPIYVVTGDAGDLGGWTPERLGEALRAPLGVLGVDVDVRPTQFGHGGTHGWDDEELALQVEQAVERVVQA